MSDPGADGPQWPPELDGQLQLPLEGIPPLTPLERAAAWLASDSNDPWSLPGLEAQLLVEDAKSRSMRVQRWAWVRDVQAPFGSGVGWLVPGSLEGPLLYHEAVRAFVDGLFLASLVCSHACCERILAARLALREALSPALERAGLGPIAKEAVEAGIIDDQLLSELLEVNQRRKVVAHYKHALIADSIPIRVARAGGGASYDEALDNVLEADARQAVYVATRVTRGLEL